MPIKRGKKGGARVSPSRALQADLSAVAAGVAGLKFMVDIPTVVAIPTLMPGLDLAMQTQGLPLETVTVVHGPTQEGKTVLAAMLVRSFQAHRDLQYFIDAERSAEVHRWFRACGIDLHEAMIFRPVTYDDVVRDVHAMLKNFRRAREHTFAALRNPAKRTPPALSRPDLAMLVVIDSITKLIPQEMLDRIAEEGVMVRDVGRIQALWNSDFMKVLPALMADLPVAVVILAHETEEPAQPGKPVTRFNRARPKVKGGRALPYEARLQFRVSSGGLVRRGADGPVIANRFWVDVSKNKMGFKATRAVLYTATEEGYARHGVPMLDLGRAAFETAVAVGLAEARGAHWRYTFEELAGVKAVAREEAIAQLNHDRLTFDTLAAAIRKAPRPPSMYAFGEVPEDPLPPSDPLPPRPER